MRQRGQHLATFLARHCGFLSVLPKDFEPDVLSSRTAVDPGLWCLTLVRFCDRARVLGRVLQAAEDVLGDAAKVRRVNSTFKRWDAALTGGVSSDWSS